MIYNKDEIKAEIKRVSQVLRETHNPHEFRQNKKYLERLERKLRIINADTNKIPW